MSKITGADKLNSLEIKRRTALMTGENSITHQIRSTVHKNYQLGQHCLGFFAIRKLNHNFSISNFQNSPSLANNDKLSNNC